MNNHKSLHILIILIALATCVSTTLTLTSLTAKHSNQGYTTDYVFQFVPTYSYQWATVRIDFPVEYILSSFQSTLDCWYSNSGTSQDYQQATCHMQPSTSLTSYFVVGSVYVHVRNVTTAAPYFVLLRNVVNPINRDMTSFFSVCLEMQNTEIQCQRTFARLLLNKNGSIISAQTASFTSSPIFQIVGQGNSYIFTFPVTPFGSWYSNSEFISVRAIFPKQFDSNQPLCSIASQLSSFETTYKPTETQTFSSRPYIIECKKITSFTSYLTNGDFISIKIDTVINPLKADIWTGIKFEIVRSIHNELIEVIPLGQSINVQMQNFIVTKKQTNFFRNATNTYYLYVNHDVMLDNSSSLYITIGNGSKWNIHSVSLLNGFTSPQTLNSIINVGSTSSSIVLSNYGTASRKLQQIIAINLTSPLLAGYHNVSLLAKVNSNNVGYWIGSFYINQTYGQFDLLSLSAVRKKVKLPANATGSLQLTFFLNYQLPESQGLKNGSLSVSVYPQLTPPNPDLNGVLKCYFKGTYQASYCTMDNSDPTKTVFTLVSPPLQAFQYSEVPILITTQGAIDQNNTGFLIDPLVTRYRFETEFYLYNSSTIPSEVFYTEWIADAVEMSTSTAKSLTHQCGEWTNVQVNLTMPTLSSLSLSRQLRIRVDFMAHPVTKINAWDINLGYSSNYIYKEYPCIVTGLIGARIKCDLYTFTSSTPNSPYNNLHAKTDSTGSYFLIYGFLNTNLNGLKVMIELPKLKIGTIANVPAMVQASILQQTPAQLQPYVALYFQNITVFTTIPAITMVQTSVATSQSSVVGVQTDQQYNVSWSPLNPSSITYVKYQISSINFPSFSTSYGSCSASLCLSFGYPANWIVQKPTLPVGSPFTMRTLASFIKTIPFLITDTQVLPIHITTYDAIGNTIEKVFMNYNYTAQPMAGYFDFLEPVYYAGLDQWYSISFSNAPVTVSTYPFVRLLLDSYLIFSSPIQCNSSTILPFNSSGLLFTLESPGSLLVYNMKQIAASGTYQMNCRLQTVGHQFNSSISPSINIQLHHNYSLGDTFTASANNVLLQQAPVFPNKAKPYKFQIDNPQIVNEQPRVNYVGSLFIDFKSATNFTNYLKIILSNHRYNKAGWTTPNSNDADPPVCLINEKRYSCSWTNNPLTVTISSVVLSIGNNKFELTSEYVAPYNGVKFPGSAGQYVTYMQLLDSNSTLLQSLSFFVNILPHDLLHFQAGSIVKDINTESVYILNFTIPNWATIPNPYNHATNYSRIFIEFPTQINGIPLFSLNLGGYKGVTNQKIGCNFTLGASLIAPIASQKLQCVLVPPEFTGGRVKIEIINHNGFSPTVINVALYIFKIFNPSVAVRSFDLRVAINQYQVGTGFVYPLFAGKYTVFLDPYAKNINPITRLTLDDQLLVNFFDPTLKLGEYGPISLTAQSLTGNVLADPYYVIFKLPSYLPVDNNQLVNPFKLCPTAIFDFCITSTEVNYVLVKAKSTPASLKVFIRYYPLSISQSDTFFQASVIEQGRYTGEIIYNITKYRWSQLQRNIILNSVTASGPALKLDLNKKYAEILVNFTTVCAVPSSGTIEIVFPPSISKIYPNCRSVTGWGSGLFSIAGPGPLGPSGQIGCAIQNNNHWAITSFQPVLNGTVIVIRGYIDLPSTSGSIGIGQIITYADTHQTDIYSKGSPIDYVKTDFSLIVSATQAMNANPDVFLTQRSVLMKNYVGEFRYVFKMNNILYPQDYIELSLYKKDIKANSGGFAINNRPIVCEFIRIDTQERIGCFVDLSTETNIYMHQALMYRLRTVENLLPSVIFEVRLTSQDYNLPQGINYPTSPGIFKIDILTNHITSNVVQMEQKYIQVASVPFYKLIITQFNFHAGYYSPFWVQLSPSLTIPMNHQLIFQFPTLSNDGTRLFLDDLGWSSVGNGEGIPIDMFDCIYSNTFMNCRIFFGSYQYGKPAKIICGNFQSPIAAFQTLKFAFSMTNPSPVTVSTLSQLAIPIFIYSYDPQLYQRINYNTVNVGVIINNHNNTAVPSGFFSTPKNQLQTPGQFLSLSRYNTKAFVKGDFYVMKFNFPLRVNTMINPGCMDTILGFKGTIYYHQNLRTIICAWNGALGTNSMPLSANLVLSNFYTPWYLLTTPQRQVTAIASYQLTAQSQYIAYFDLFPLLNARSLGFLPSPYFNLAPVLAAHNIACQQSDYVFTMRLQSNPSTNFNLQYTKMVLIVFPNAGISDFQAVNTDCMEHNSSTIEIVSCQIKLVLPRPIIQIVIVPGLYQNGETIAIVTRGLAIKNPCIEFSYWTFGSSSYRQNVIYWQVYYLSFENGTAMTPSTSYAYMTINSANMQFNGMFINYQHLISSQSLYSPFDWIEIPYERYFNQFLQYDKNQYSPFSFEFQLQSNQSTNNFNKLTVQFGGNYIPCGNQSFIDDLSIFTPICYLHNTRVQKCYVDLTTNTTYMEFNFPLPPNIYIHAYFSVVDPRNPQLNGYSYIGADDISQINIKLSSPNATYLFQTPPFAAAESQVTPIGALPIRGITYATIDYGNNIGGQLNVLDMVFTVSRSDITALRFEIPLVDANGSPIFGPTFKASFFDLENGDEYPCGNNQIGITSVDTHKCYLFYGGPNLIASPVQIIMTDFKQTTTINARLLLMNPSSYPGRWVSVNVMAFTGKQDEISLYGGNVAGYWSFSDVYQISNPSVSTVSQEGNGCCYPGYGWYDFFRVNRYLWRESTTFSYQSSPWTSVGSYMILELPLYQYDNGSPDDEICRVNFQFGNANTDDVIYLKRKQTGQQKAYFVKKWNGATWLIQYFKCKHYNNRFKTWHNIGKTSATIVNYHLQGSYTYSPAVGYSYSLNYFYIFPLDQKTYIQFDLTYQINTQLPSQSFIWDKNTHYHLYIQYSNFNPSIQKCMVVQGIVSSYMNMPVKCTQSGTGVMISGFTQIVYNTRIGRYRVKLQLQHSSYSSVYTGSYYYPYVYLYAHPSALTNNWYIFYASYSTINLFQIYSYSWSCSSWWNPCPAPSNSVNYYYSHLVSYGYGLTTNLINLGMNAAQTSVQLNLKLTPTSNISMITGSPYGSSQPYAHTYPQFRFVVNNYPFQCSGYIKFIVTLHRYGNTYPIDFSDYPGSLITCPTLSQIRINFFYYSANIGRWGRIFAGGVQGASGAYWDTDTTIQFDIQMPITSQIEPMNYRQWISVSSSLVIFQISNPSCYCSCYFSSSCLLWSGNSNKGFVWGQKTHAYSEALWQTTLPLFAGVSLQPLTNNVNQPTQMSIIFSSAQISFGPINYGKILLLELTPSFNPFSYLNASSTLLNKIECKCSINGLTAVDKVCHFRDSGISGLKTAITLDLQLTIYSSATCYFPDWMILAGTLTVKAKLTNDYGGFPSYYSTYNTYGGFYVTSDSITFSNAAAIPLATITQTSTPSIYSPTSQVDTFQQDYTLTITVPQTTNQAIVYIDFQKGGIIPDLNLCTNTYFLFCRVYRTWRHIMVAQFKLPTAAGGSLLLKSNFNFNTSLPTHWEYGADSEYHLMVRVIQNSAENFYSFKGKKERIAAYLIPTPINVTVYPQRSTGSLLAGYTTNVIISFNISNQTLYSYYLNNANAHIDINCTDATILANSRGCTVVSEKDPTFKLYCQIQGGLITIQNRNTANFTTTGLIQIIIGLTNPAASVNFTVIGYQYYYNLTNYGSIFVGTVTYRPTLLNGTILMQASQLKMYPFYTKIYSSTFAPFRIGFKLSPVISTITTPGYYFIINNLDAIAGFTSFQCLIRAFSTYPTSNQQTIFPNSYRNYKQRTQHQDMFVICNTHFAGLKVTIPGAGLQAGIFYELVITPAATTQSGFANAVDSMFKIIAHPISSERIDQLFKYLPGSFTLVSMKVVTKRPLSPTALQIEFNISFSSNRTYPNHYLQITFRDLDMTSIRPPYNIPGSKVPCSLSSLFVSLLPARKQTPACVFQTADLTVGTVVVKVTQIGNIIAGAYQLTFDDFLLPDLISPPLEDSCPFTLCLRLYDFVSNIKYENCFDQIFVIDYSTSTTAQLEGTDSLSISDNMHGVLGVAGTLSIASYPLTSTGQLNQKMMMRVNDGYAGTTPTPISLPGYTLLWHNPMVNLYIFQQKSINTGAATTLTLDSLSNPEVYQMSLYTAGSPTIQLTFYNKYHPIKHYVYSQPTFSSFALETAQIYATSVLYTDDVKQTVSFTSPFTFQLELVILDTPAVISKKQINRIEIIFNANVSRVDICWIDTKVAGQTFKLDGECIVASPNKILLQDFQTSFNSNNIILYIQLRLLGANVTYDTTVYCINNQIQYSSTESKLFSNNNASLSTYSLLDFTQNIYTPGYHQIVTQVNRTINPKYLHLVLQLPADLVYNMNTFTITLPTSILPVNRTTQNRMICEWLTTDRNLRKYNTGVHSVCSFSAPNNIVVQAPFGSLPRLSSTNIPITYLLKIRQFFLVNTLFTVPAASNDLQITLTHKDINTGVTLQDTLVIYPYSNFQSGKLQVNTFTRTAGELNTYQISFTPQNTVSIGLEAVLELSIDARYMPSYLGLKNLYKQYGIDTTNTSWINNAGFSIGYSYLPTKWVNGLPYTGITSTSANAEQTCFYQDDKTFKLSLLLENKYFAGVNYNWKIPLLMNPTSSNMTFRMNLTLYTYWNGTPRQQKQLFYEIINPFATLPNNSAPVQYNFTSTALANTIQSSTATVNIDFSYPFVPDTANIIELKISNRGVALIGLNNFYNPMYNDGSYIFYFFKRINLILCLKQFNNSSPTIDFGTLQKTNNFTQYFGYDWVKVHSNKVPQTIYNGASLFAPLVACSIVTVTPIISEGIASQAGSQFLQQFTFTTPCWIQKYSILSIQFDSSLYTWSKQVPCYTSFKSASCIYAQNGNLTINFNQFIASNKIITFSIYLKVLQTPTNTTSNIVGYIYALPQNNNTVIESIPFLNTLPAITSSSIFDGDMQNLIILPLYQNTYSKIIGRLSPHYMPVTYIQIIHPFTWTANSHHRFLYRLNISDLLDDTKSLYWMQANQTLSLSNKQNFTIEPSGLLDYNLYTNLQYTFVMSSNNDSSKLNNFSVGPVGKLYNFVYESDKQIQYQEVYPLPVADTLTMIVPVKAVNQPTILGLKFKMQTNPIKPGDIIEIYLDSFNLMKNMYQYTTTPIQCAEGVKGILTSSVDLICDVWQYPQNKKPIIIRVFPQINVAANTSIQIWLSPLINPPASIVAGAIVKVTVDCLGQQRCQIYEARGYYGTKSLSITQYGDTSSTFTPSNTQVLKTGVAHTFTFNTQTATAAMFDYPENYDNLIIHNCINALGKCIVFPNQKRIVLLPTIATSLSSLQLLSMNNGMYVSPLSKYINLTIVSSSNVQYYNTLHNNLTTIKTNYLQSAPNSMTIIPTQSPNIFVRNYMNTAVMTFKGLYTDPYIKAFYIHAPKDIVTWDTTYCNATLGTFGNNPYPARLNCALINDTTLSINIPDGVSYVAGVTDAQAITLNCKFYIKDFSVGQNILYVSAPVISGTFNAYGSYSQVDDDYHFFATEVSQTITISQYQIPPIGNIQFTTESYIQRFANINDRLHFDLLFDPAASDPISLIQIRLPRQFGYPPVGNHDACLMVSRTTVPIQNCQQIRKDNQTFILITPPLTYNNGPVIITIANQNYSNWFTAPPMPGSWYNYTVSAYAANGTLLQRQSCENCSTIGGLQLDVPSMTIRNGLDSMMEQIVDISFAVGPVALNQGYPDGLQTGDYYTNIKITFENWGAFNNLLNVNNQNQTLVGCFTSGMNFTHEIKCLLIGGSDIQHEPAILISGYERVPAYTNISISLANILMLDTNTRNVLSVSVILRKIGSWHQSYLYNPQQLTLKKTSNIAVLPLNYLDLGYVGINKVGSNSSFYLAVNPSVDINTYFVVKLPDGFINPNYTLFNTSCDNGKSQIFYRSNTIRIYPKNGLHPSNTLINYTIYQFPSTAYVINMKNFPIYLQAYRNYKQIHSQIFNMMFQSYPCQITSGLVSLSSPYIFDTNLTYVFEVNMPNRPVYPDKSTLSLTIPQQYPSLFSQGVSCTVIAPMACSILTQRMVLVRYIERMNSSTILVQIHGITNPSSTNHTFKVQTYDGDNVNQVKCQSSIPIRLRKADEQSCSLSVNSSLSTINTQAKYHFIINCPNVFRNNSNIRISISKDYLNNNKIGPLKCWSDNPFNLMSGNCFLLYTNATLYISFKNINTQKNQLSIGLYAIFNNTIYPKVYDYQAYIDLYGQNYATTKTQGLPFISNAINKISSINLYNLPGASGSHSIYILKLPSKFVSNSIQIDFPRYFDIDDSIVSSIYFFNNTYWFQNLTYFDLLQYTYQSEVLSSVQLTSLGAKTITAQNITVGSGAWCYLMFKFIINPSYYDSTYSFSVRSINLQKQLLYLYEGPLNIQISVPSNSVHMTGLKTEDSDLTMLTVHNITYRVDQPIYLNSTSFVITPPKPANLYAVTTLKCCIFLNYNQLIECNPCRIGKHQIQYKFVSQGLTFSADQIFTIQLSSLYTPETSNQCQGFKDYLRSYYHLLIFRNGTTLTHESIQPSADEFTPCQTYTPFRGDTLLTIPSTLYAGLAYEVPISISRPSKMLRVFLKSASYDLTFTPNNGTYFNSYDIKTLSVFILVNPNSRAATTTIKIAHNQSIFYNIFRDNLPVVVQIRTDPQEYVYIPQSQYFSVGNYITIPIKITHIASYDMYLIFKTDGASNQFQLQTNPIQIPALTKNTSFRFRYNGTTVPQTINVALQLQSSSLIKHKLKPSIIYFFFSITPQFQTLPPVMKLKIMHRYTRNSQFASKKIYNANTSSILYDQLLPVIIKHQDVSIGSTKASIRIFTRNEAEVYYMLLERGNNYPNATPVGIRTNHSAKMSLTSRNTSQYVNAYKIINFTHLEHQTMYSVYAMAHDTLGDSIAYVIHSFMTKALPNAVQLRIDTSSLITDVVYLVHAISQVLDIDILRVKVVDSYIIKNQTWTKNKVSKNQLYYRNRVVISPSLIDDTPIPLDLVDSVLINNPENRLKLKNILPEFIDNFVERKLSANSDEWPLIQLIVNLPKIKTKPNVISVSYYTMSLTYQLYSKAIIYVVAIELCEVQTLSLFNISRTKFIYGSKIGNLTDDIPYSKQIILNKNSFNKNVSTFAVVATDKQGNAVIKLSNLKSGAKYDFYLTFSTPQTYQPILYAATQDIMTLTVTTLENPNIKGRDDALVLKQLKAIDPDMYQIIRAHKSFEKNVKNLN